ncbi:MAG: NADH-quinone oxidoreductase subunit NuoK [Planctomycetota bacterium]
MTSWYLALGAILFALGVLGFAVRRNSLIMFMSVELMLNAVNLTIVALAHQNGALAQGVVLALFVIAVAAAEVAVGLAIIIALYRLRETVDADEVRTLRG